MVTVRYTKFVDGRGVRIWSQGYGSMRSAETVLGLNGYEFLGINPFFSKPFWKKEFEGFCVIAFAENTDD